MSACGNAFRCRGLGGFLRATQQEDSQFPRVNKSVCVAFPEGFFVLFSDGAEENNDMLNIKEAKRTPSPFPYPL